MSGSKRKKTNPRRIPATKADVERIKKDSTDAAVFAAWAIMFSVLRDKHGWGCEQLQQFWKEVDYLSESVSAGHVKLNDLARALKDEEGIVLTR